MMMICYDKCEHCMHDLIGYLEYVMIVVIRCSFNLVQAFVNHFTAVIYGLIITSLLYPSCVLPTMAYIARHYLFVVEVVPAKCL